MAEYRMNEESVNDVVQRMGVRGDAMGSTQGEVNRLIGVVEANIVEAQAQEAPLVAALADLETASADSQNAADGADVTGASWERFRGVNAELDTSVKGSTENMRALFQEFRVASNALMEELNTHKTEFDRYLGDARATSDDHQVKVGAFRDDVAAVFQQGLS